MASRALPAKLTYGLRRELIGFSLCLRRRVLHRRLAAALTARPLSHVRRSGVAMSGAGPPAIADFDPVQYLAHHGFRARDDLPAGQPLWTFQWIEGGWLLAVALILVAVTVWRVRCRAT